MKRNIPGPLTDKPEGFERCVARQLKQSRRGSRITTTNVDSHPSTKRSNKNRRPGQERRKLRLYMYDQSNSITMYF